MTSKKQKPKEKEKRKLSWWELVLIIIAVLFIFDFLDGSDDYEYCVDRCVSSLDTCSSSSMEYIGYTGYITEYNTDDCYYDLKDCVRDCKK